MCHALACFGVSNGRRVTFRGQKEHDQIGAMHVNNHGVEKIMLDKAILNLNPV